MLFGITSCSQVSDITSFRIRSERVNGIIKNEFIPKKIYQHYREAKKSKARIIDLYNEKRPLANLDYLTRAQAQNQEGTLKKRWKTYSNRKTNQLVVEII